MAKKKTFEDSMTQLEKIVEDLEDGDLPLETAIKKFEEGVRLSKFCFDKLDETEKKVSLLLQDQNGKIQEKPFSANDTIEDR
ncbi:MAG: exodeoxyribonuclease VII small subunit [Desulfobacteraceae bacterium]|nr:exodeoxyribonuclease VII small subunit [Desulfobacteraceae bacterium]MBC2755844.1 exodeoxyribonuclease VII small subunit [Desulfobacteraceae bacterium]